MKAVRFLIVSLAAYLILIPGISAQTTEFSYQGIVTDNNAPANGNYDLEFRLFNVETGGTVLGTQFGLNTPVVNGIFKVALDFGAFPSGDRFLEIGVKPAGGGSFTYLTPRSKVLSTPFATRAINAQNALSAVNATNATFSQNAVNATNATNATTAQNALNLGGTAANQFVRTTDPRLSDARSPLPGSTNYIRNGTVVQTSANFNINGNGTVLGTLTGGTVSATTQFNLGNNRVLAKVGVNNLFLGTLAGADNGGIQNTMVGDSAGRDNTGDENAYFGFVAGQLSTTGSDNSFFGSRSGQLNTTGSENVFVGKFAGNANTTGSSNTIIGASANVGAVNLTNAAAIGSRAFVEQSNSLILGSINGVNGATATTDVGIGVTQPARRLDVNGIIRVGLTTGTIGCVEDRDGTVIAGTCASDLRFKKNVTPFGNILNNFSKLRPVNFYWRADEFVDQHFGGKQSYGLIAQEVEQAFPELVATDEKGFKAVNYSKLPFYTIQAVKEQQAQIEEQRKMIDELTRSSMEQAALVKEQTTRLDTLMEYLCKNVPTLAVCVVQEKKDEK